MSVLIKTMMNLPEHCYDCPCHDGESGYCQADEAHRYSDYRPFWCPLVNISNELEQELCDDTVSRQAVLALAKEECDTAIIPYRKFVKDVNALPPVRPQPKMGRWIKDKCSICGEERSWYGQNPPYCPDCGAKMAESNGI